ncbi:cupin [Mycobacterium sp. E2462]|nr:MULTISPECIES: cupin domain-containing protein [unclassified Mycobacterium]OBG74386.1 cupin [Mycobacterium sp. E1214]OBH25866.1 cupin [Mycobacterium sp. E1319]OBI17039.1 cupin [Mycobacterium sp. E2462]
MCAESATAEVLYRIAAGTAREAFEVFGPSVEFVTWSDEEHGQFCVMRAVVPPGVTVPLHSHPDAEDFLILAGTHQVLIESDRGLRWQDAHAGDYVRIPGGVLHAHRNVSDEPAVDLIVTTLRMGKFFTEVGLPSTGEPIAVTADRLRHFVAITQKYGYTLASPEQNAAVGIDLPVFSG